MTEGTLITIRPVQTGDLPVIGDRLIYDNVTDAETLALARGDEGKARRIMLELHTREHPNAHQWSAVVAHDGDAVVGLLDYSTSRATSRLERMTMLAKLLGPVGFARALPVVYARVRVDTPAPPEAFFIANVRVDECQRGRGIGAQLMEWAEEHARETGRRRMALQTFTNNPAMRLYERLGFRVTVSRDHALYQRYVGTGRCLMEKVLED